MKTLRLVPWLLLLSACPGLPDSGLTDADVADGEVFVPLELHRIYQTTGEPEGGERVAIYGAGFQPGAIVTFDGEPADAVLVLDEGQLNATVPTHSPGLVDVTVTLPDGQSATLESAYLYVGPLELYTINPTVSSVDGGVEVEVQGLGFDDDTRILIGGRMLEDQRRLDDTTAARSRPAS
ncbi:MAG TPA: IPT/TIG domain-containing protein [Myxococcota bacterium]|nr:IPT/TIG domain-containing protein [Myxococcota bacterium]